MSAAQQTCPWCEWHQLVRLPDGLAPDYAELIGRHVSRSLQWEWQVHMVEKHWPEAEAADVLTVEAFRTWTASEDAPHHLRMETPPGEGVGETVGVNLPALTADQTKQLAESMGQVMATIADGIQNWATQMVPAIRAAAEGATRAVRSAGCQCESSVIGWHTAGAVGCLYRHEPAQTLQAHICGCDGFESGHVRGAVGCIVQADLTTEPATAKVLDEAARLRPGLRGPEFWRRAYGEVPEPDGTDKP